jgi:NitT/TauT family transport system substrate-binding protein
MITRRRLLAGLTAAPVAAGLAACGGGSSKAATGRDAATFLTGFGTTPRETFAWVGLAKGFFGDAGIDLTVLPGQPSDANLKSLAAGKAQFAAVDYVSAVRGTANFPDYRAIEVMQTTTLLSMVTLADRGISKPADLAHRTLGTAPASATQTLFPAYAKAAGFDPTTDKIVNAPSDQLPSLLASGRVDAIGAYFTDTANVENAAPGKTAVAFPYGQFITDLYGTVILATTGVLSGKPDLVQRFAAAMAKTMQYCVDNPEEAGRLVQSQLPTVKGAVVAKVDTRLKQYVGPFTFDHDKVVRSIAVLQGAGLAKAGLTPEDVVDFGVATKAGLH